ncbi:hypothetical protein C2845_PM03G23290 [Panicum miliaceum]|uniref:Pectinesterase inhibitor domain-containing protein n=1 Tax=Panicum miliaceum TaxID=4540 RepID=A0A3L6TCF3_PANMI|nr:hypothetical protein C2845_PM03G23290 [Panicum miliaceum]
MRPVNDSKFNPTQSTESAFRPYPSPTACKRAYAAGGGAFNEDFCLSALNGPSAGAADNGDLALVAVDLATATATDAQLNGGGGGRPEGVSPPDCHAAMKDQRFGDGKMCLGRTARAPVACERGFEQLNLLLPVAAEDDALANLAIALASIA